MNPLEYIATAAKRCVATLYGTEPADSLIQVQPTRKEFEGDVTLVVFPLLKTSRKAPEATATEIGESPAPVPRSSVRKPSCWEPGKPAGSWTKPASNTRRFLFASCACSAKSPVKTVSRS